MIAELARGLLLTAVKQQIAGVGQVVCHKTRRELRVALLDGNQNRLMELQRMFQLNKLGGHHDHVQHGTVDRLEQPFGQTIA